MSYAIIGCSNCDQLWILENHRDSETTQCPCCGSEHQTESLRPKYEHEDFDVVAEIRSKILAERAGEKERYENEDDYGVLGARVDDRLSEFTTGRYKFGEAAVQSRLEEFYDRLEVNWDRFDPFEEDAQEHLSDDEWLIDDLLASAPGELPSSDRVVVEPPEEPPEYDLETTLGLTDQPPVNVDATVLSPPLAPTELWSELIDPETSSLGDHLFRAADQLLKGHEDVVEAGESLVENHAVTALEDTRSGLSPVYHYARALATVIDPSPKDRANVAALTAQLGRGQPRGLRSQRSDISEGPLRLFEAAVAQGAERPRVALGLPQGFWDARRVQRERWLDLVLEAARVWDIRLVCSVFDRVKLWEEHRTLLPADVSGEAHPGRGRWNDDRVEEAATEALEELGLENERWDILRVLADQRGNHAPYRTLYGDSRLPLDDSTIRRHVTAFQDLGLITEFKDAGTVEKMLTPAGYAALATVGSTTTEDVGTELDECGLDLGVDPEELQASLEDDVDEATASFCRRCESTSGVMQSRFSASPEPERAAFDVSALPPCERPVKPLRKCRVNRHAGTGGGTGQRTAAATGRSGLSDTTFLSPAEHHAIATASQSGGLALDDRPVSSRDDAREAWFSFNSDRDEVVVDVEWDGPLATAVRLCAALTCDGMWSQVLTAERIDENGEGFAGLVEDNPYVLRRTRCLGHLKDADADAESYRRRLRGAREDLLRLAGEVRGPSGEYDEDLARDILRDAHGLIGTVTQLLDLAGVDLVRQIQIPEYSRNIHDKRHTLLTFLSRALPIASRKGHYSAMRVLYEPRPDKREQVMGAPDCSTPAGDHIGGWVLAGPGVDKLAPDLEDGVEGDLELQEGGENYADFAVDVPVVAAQRRRAVAEVAERVGEMLGLRPTREAVAILFATTGSPMDVAQALLTLGGQDDDEWSRDMDLFEIRFALAQFAMTPAGSIDEARVSRLLPDVAAADGRGIQKVFAALLVCDDVVSQAELARLAGVNRSTVRAHEDRLEAAGLLDVERGPNGAAHGYRLRLPFRDERRGEDTQSPTFTPGVAPEEDRVQTAENELFHNLVRHDDSTNDWVWLPHRAVAEFAGRLGIDIDDEELESVASWDLETFDWQSFRLDDLSITDGDLREWVVLVARLVGERTVEVEAGDSPHLTTPTLGQVRPPGQTHLGTDHGEKAAD